MDFGLLVLEFTSSFGNLFYWFSTPVGELSPILSRSVISDIPLIAVMFGSGLTIYIIYQLVKWVLDIVL